MAARRVGLSDIRVEARSSSSRPPFWISRSIFWCWARVSARRRRVCLRSSRLRARNATPTASAVSRALNRMSFADRLAERIRDQGDSLTGGTLLGQRDAEIGGGGPPRLDPDGPLEGMRPLVPGDHPVLSGR